MRLFIVLIVLIGLIPCAIAQEINFFKEEYGQGETVQGEIILPIDIVQELKNTQLHIISQENQEVPLQINLLIVNKNHYFFYYDLPLTVTEEEYTLKIRDISYRENGILKTRSYEKKFDIVTQQYEKIQITPGIASYLPGETTYKAIRVSNQEDHAITLSLYETQEIIPTLNILQIPGKSSKTFYLRIVQENIQTTGIVFFKLGSYYYIPVYLTKPVSEDCLSFWQCSPWSSCENKFQKRTCNDLNNCKTIINKPQEQQSCEIICTPSWQCSPWSACNTGTQTRICNDTNNCNQEETKPIEQKSCNSCNENWQCSPWSSCENKFQKRTCNDLNNCKTIINKPQEQQSCEIICTPSWQCSPWSACNTGTQTRICNDTNNCNEVCITEECKELQLCQIKRREVINDTSKNILSESQEKKEVIFFSDINNQQITVNSLINEKIPEKKELKGQLFIKNTGKDLINLKIYLTGNLNEIVKINITNSSIFKQDEIITQFLWINSEKNPQVDEYQGAMILTAENFSEEFPIFLVISHESQRKETEEPLFIEQRTETIEQEHSTQEQKSMIERENKPVKIEIPYKEIAGTLFVIFIFLVYFIIKKPSQNKRKFSDFISKLEKR